jgi:hypothetical protein
VAGANKTQLAQKLVFLGDSTNVLNIGSSITYIVAEKRPFIKLYLVLKTIFRTNKQANQQNMLL